MKNFLSCNEPCCTHSKWNYRLLDRQDLRQKNWKAMDALCQMEKVAEHATSYKSDLESKDSQIVKLKDELKTERAKLRKCVRESLITPDYCLLYMCFFVFFITYDISPSLATYLRLCEAVCFVIDVLHVRWFLTLCMLSQFKTRRVLITFCNAHCTLLFLNEEISGQSRWLLWYVVICWFVSLNKACTIYIGLPDPINPC